MIQSTNVGWASPTIGSRHWQLVGTAHPTSAACPPRLGGPTARRSFTLVEMLIAMAITLVMMAAVVTLFANVTNGVRKSRATIEMSSQVRHVRNVLQKDVQGATCPGLTWQRPESNHGYIELIEGPYREGNATNLIDADPPNNRNWPPTETNPEIDHAISILPSSNLAFKDPTWATDGGGLGDYDDILMLTVRNEREPFVGRIPLIGDKQPYANWGYESIESPLAEVVWFAMENPGYTEDPPFKDPTANHFFGEPGMRTIYRRTLLITPWLNPYGTPEVDRDRDGIVNIGGKDFKAVPGLLRILPQSSFPPGDWAAAYAALVSFQERYDISCRVEWDYSIQHWKIIANTLADLTKRENRFDHFGIKVLNNSKFERFYPYPLVSIGSGYSGSSKGVEFVTDPDIGGPANDAKATANLASGAAVSYSIDPNNLTDTGRRYPARPLAYVDDTPTGVPATAQAMLNDDGQVVRVVHGPVPLWGPRRGEDVMMTDVLAFDVRVYDPGAPLFATRKPSPSTELDVVLSPTDPGWLIAYMHANNMGTSGPSGGVGNGNSISTVVYPYVGQGAYVDLGYGYDSRYSPPNLPYPYYSPNYAAAGLPWFFTPRALSDVYGNQLAPGFAVYDTWSFHYENDGVDEDVDGTVDQGTDGLDGIGRYANPTPPPLTVDDTRLGVDDVGERETVPPYDKPLRGVQVLVRTYERDSRAIRQVRVNQHFMAE